ncbi:vWA domain-containing protein [Ancylobacter pratisalsi]|uniref:VWA domain-containing protein n=1 Tax=Ancylobacter pratisalsi TaxID=1745854 RepID=A0A6P1YSU8_9HYPH|nr:vWA domain-containing protein [Ancylobacter pratisalsi]QIB35766.1 VWA domain-containing protein [Ancylobacter pratisalsi]
MSGAIISAMRERGARHWRVLLIGFALAALVVALVAPRIERLRPARDILTVIDVTGSMNVRDGVLEGRPASRLDVSKRSVRALLAALPCGSRFGLGIFTERRSFLLFEPTEVCANFAALDGAVSALDWRMAWEGDSYVARGVHAGIALAEGVGADLVFLTDGHEAPPLAGGALPAFDGRPGEVRGLIVGVGGSDPVPIPKYNEDGREVGFYGELDVPQENRSGPPPADAHLREGWNPRNAPWGGEAARGTEHLSALREDHLRALAAQTGLAYARLEAPGSLAGDVIAATRARAVTTRVDTAPIAGALALVALLALYSASLFLRLARGRRRRLTALHNGSLP